MKYLFFVNDNLFRMFILLFITITNKIAPIHLINFFTVIIIFIVGLYSCCTVEYIPFCHSSSSCKTHGLKDIMK